MVDNNDVESLWKPVQVCLPHQFAQAVGDDVYLCEYEYDTQFQVGFAVIRSASLQFGIGPLPCIHVARLT